MGHTIKIQLSDTNVLGAYNAFYSVQCNISNSKREISIEFEDSIVLSDILVVVRHSIDDIERDFKNLFLRRGGDKE